MKDDMSAVETHAEPLPASMFTKAAEEAGEELEKIAFSDLEQYREVVNFHDIGYLMAVDPFHRVRFTIALRSLQRTHPKALEKGYVWVKTPAVSTPIPLLLRQLPYAIVCLAVHPHRGQKFRIHIHSDDKYLCDKRMHGNCRKLWGHDELHLSTNGLDTLTSTISIAAHDPSVNSFVSDAGDAPIDGEDLVIEIVDHRRDERRVAKPKSIEDAYYKSLDASSFVIAHGVNVPDDQKAVLKALSFHRESIFPYDLPYIQHSDDDTFRLKLEAFFTALKLSHPEALRKNIVWIKLSGLPHPVPLLFRQVPGAILMRAIVGGPINGTYHVAIADDDPMLCYMGFHTACRWKWDHTREHLSNTAVDDLRLTLAGAIFDPSYEPLAKDAGETPDYDKDFVIELVDDRKPIDTEDVLPVFDAEDEQTEEQRTMKELFNAMTAARGKPVNASETPVAGTLKRTLDLIRAINPVDHTAVFTAENHMARRRLIDILLECDTYGAISGPKDGVVWIQMATASRPVAVRPASVPAGIFVAAKSAAHTGLRYTVTIEAEDPRVCNEADHANCRCCWIEEGVHIPAEGLDALHKLVADTLRNDGTAPPLENTGSAPRDTDVVIEIVDHRRP